jgi:hypothetical protein
MSTFKTKTLLQEADELVKVAVSLVCLDELLELLSVNDEVETANLGQNSFLSTQAS